MFPVVLRHIVSPRTSPGPRNAVPQDTGPIQAQHGSSRPWSVPWSMVGALAHRQYSGSLSVRKRIASVQVHGRCSGAWSVLLPIVSAQAHRQCPAHGRDSRPWPVLRAWSVFTPMANAQPMVSAQPMVGTQAYCQCSGPSAVLGPCSALRRIGGAPAYGRCSGALAVRRSMVGAHNPWSVRTTHGRCAQPMVGPWSVRKPIGSAQAHWQCSGPSSVHKAHGRCSCPSSVPRQKTEDRRPAPRSTRPNKGVQATANKLRSCLAPLVRRA
jgi:hypothetical protein